MARFQHAVIWTALSASSSSTNIPMKMGDLILTEEQSLFTYTKEYRSTGLPGFSLLSDASIWGKDTVSYPVSERISVFPRLLSLLPGSNPRNLQRRHYLNLLRIKLGKEPSPGLETEWQLLIMGGHGGIGHIDVFANDIVAENWYKKDLASSEDKHQKAVSGSRSPLWRMLKHEVLDENIDFDPRIIEEALGPTPSVGGMIPKLLVAIDLAVNVANKTKFYPPNPPLAKETSKIDVVLKIEPPEYRGLLDLEALCLDIHHEAGFEVPDYYRYSHDDLEFLAVERFDRKHNKVVPMESLFSVIASGDHQFRETGDILLDELGDYFEKLCQIASLPKNTNEELYSRFIMALLTGNGDLHLENISLLGGLLDCRLSPIYDPAPMRAWPRHNIISAIPFDPVGYKNHAEYFIELGRFFKLTNEQVSNCLEKALEYTAGYADRIMVLERVPLNQREQLVTIVGKERELLMNSR